jgi:predicted nucleic acid-binding protein
MIVLDTNVVSEPSRKEPSRRVIAWLNDQDTTRLHLCAPVYAELVFGAALHQDRHGSRIYFEKLEEIRFRVIRGEFLDFDERASIVFGKPKALSTTTGNNRPHLDLMIAAICIANGATLATRNTRDFEGLDLKLVNPFEPT